MMWPFKRRKQASPTSESNVVDFDRKSVPLDDRGDATSLLFAISMSHGYAVMGKHNEDGTWTVDVGDRGHWTAPTQLEALTAAWTDLEAGRHGS